MSGHGWMVAAALLLAGVSCKSPAPGPYDADKTVVQESARAERLSKEAAELIETDPERAEALLREALGADLFFGPAHNNLGVLHLTRGELYEAAHEFEWARKLMPGHPDPRVNLALTLDAAGKSAEAIESSTAALEVYPRYVPAKQGLAALTVRARLKDERLVGWLETIALEGETAEWREWARGELASSGLQQTHGTGRREVSR